MKLLKYAFLDGLYIRGIAFAVISVMNLVFLFFASFENQHFAALVTFVSLSGTAIAVMIVFNIIGDIVMVRQIFSAPRAYLYALSPVKRWKNLLARISAMMIMDMTSMVLVIIPVVILSLRLAGLNLNDQIFSLAYRQYFPGMIDTITGILFFLGGYLQIVSVILFCITIYKSLLFNVRASGLLAFLCAYACFYLFNLMQVILIPFGSFYNQGLFLFIFLSNNGSHFMYILLLFLQSAGLLFLASKLMEKRINI